MSEQERMDELEPGLSRRVVVTAVLSLVALVALGALGLRWRADVPVRVVEVRGAVHADRSSILERLDIQPGAALYAVDPRLVRDGAEQDPWVSSARVGRMPSGKLVVTVRERRPVLLAMGNEGVPVCFIDREGFQMPVVGGAVYVVPLLIGLAGPCL